MELEFARLQKLNELQAAIGYKFKDTELLNTALTHTSYVKGDGNGSVHLSLIHISEPTRRS